MSHERISSNVKGKVMKNEFITTALNTIKSYVKPDQPMGSTEKPNVNNTLHLVRSEGVVL